MSRQPFEDEVLLNLVKHKTYAEQADLQIALKASGVAMPQATLSRRLKKLNIAKVNGSYQVIRQHSSNPVTKITMLAPNLVIINTLPGHANSVAYLIDDQFVHDRLYGITGSIAGDDTIFVAVADSQLKTAHQKLEAFFQKAT